MRFTVTKIKLDGKIRIRKNALWKTVGEEIVVLNLENSEYFEMNHAGSKVWQFSSDNERTVEEISSLLAKELQIPIETAQRDTKKFFNNLLKHKLVEVIFQK